MKKILLTILLVLVCSTTYAERFFRQHSTWYEKIPTSPSLDSNSANVVARVAVTATGNRLALNYRGFSIPVWYATASTPLVNFACKDASTNCDINNYHGYMLNIPLPPEAREAAYGQPGFQDDHMVIISADKRYSWDFNQCSVDARTAKIIKKFDLTGDGVIQPLPVPYVVDSPFVGNPRAGQVPLLHGLITYKEVKAGLIDHAIAMGYGGLGSQYALGRFTSVYPCEQDPNVYVAGWSDHVDAPRLGHRFQLDTTLDINDPNDWGGSALSVGQKIIATALQQYGMINCINSGPGDFSIFLENIEFDGTRSWADASVYIFGSGRIFPSDFRVIQPLQPPFNSMCNLYLQNHKQKIKTCLAMCQFNLYTSLKSLFGGNR